MSTNGKTLKFRATKLKGFTVVLEYVLLQFIQIVAQLHYY